MMRRETAYKLAGRRHEHRDGMAAGMEKIRELRFRALPPNQTERAWAALSELPGVSVEAGTHPRSLTVRYSILQYSLESSKRVWRRRAFTSIALFFKLCRALVHFCEETQRHNLLSPERLLKQSNEVYIKAYEHHPHGDHDDTPVELRGLQWSLAVGDERRPTPAVQPPHSAGRDRHRGPAGLSRCAALVVGAGGWAHRLRCISPLPGWGASSSAMATRSI